MGKLRFKTDGSPGGVKVLKQGFNVDPLLQKQADCISTMTYNEYWQVIDAGYKPSQLVVFKYDDKGMATLEDGLLFGLMELKDPALRRRDGALRLARLDEGLGGRARQSKGRRQVRARQRRHRHTDRASSDADVCPRSTS